MQPRSFTKTYRPLRLPPFFFAALAAALVLCCAACCTSCCRMSCRPGMTSKAASSSDRPPPAAAAAVFVTAVDVTAGMPGCRHSAVAPVYEQSHAWFHTGLHWHSLATGVTAEQVCKHGWQPGCSCSTGQRDHPCMVSTAHAGQQQPLRALALTIV